MNTLEEIIELFIYHTPDEANIQKHEITRNAFIELASILYDELPDGAGKTFAIRQLQLAMMAANACIANKGN